MKSELCNHNIKHFYNALKVVYRPQSSGSFPLLDTDRTQMLTKKKQILEKQAGPFNWSAEINDETNILQCNTLPYSPNVGKPTRPGLASSVIPGTTTTNNLADNEVMVIFEFERQTSSSLPHKNLCSFVRNYDLKIFFLHMHMKSDSSASNFSYL